MNLEDLEALNARERAALADRLDLELLRPIAPYTPTRVPLRDLQAHARAMLSDRPPASD